MVRLDSIRQMVAGLGFVVLASAWPAAAETGKKPELTRLVISVNGFKNEEGRAGIAVFRSADGFPSDRHKAVAGRALAIKKGRVQWTIPELKPGRYAILVLHDENSNGKMDTNLLGIPTEGYGVSRDARRQFGPPLFDEAAFMVQGAQQAVRIKVEY